MADSHARRHGGEVAEGRLAPLEKRVTLAVALEFGAASWPRRRAAFRTRLPATEWSMTSSAGMSGLTRSGLPPRAFTASRMAARSTTAGTPVKSCMRTAGWHVGDFAAGLGFGVPNGRGTRCRRRSRLRPSSRRSRFSSRIFRLKGSRLRLKPKLLASSAGRR